MSTQDTQSAVAVIGAGLDLGAGRRGVDMGPSAIRYAGLDERIVELGRRCEDWGDVVTAVAEATAAGDERMRYLAEIKVTVERIAALVARAADESYLPLVLGGDFNLRGTPELPGLRHVAGHFVDHVFAAGLQAGRAEVLERGALSDHRPVAVELTA